ISVPMDSKTGFTKGTRCESVIDVFLPVLLPTCRSQSNISALIYNQYGSFSTQRCHRVEVGRPKTNQSAVVRYNTTVNFCCSASIPKPTSGLYSQVNGDDLC